MLFFVLGWLVGAVGDDEVVVEGSGAPEGAGGEVKSGGAEGSFQGLAGRVGTGAAHHPTNPTGEVIGGVRHAGAPGVVAEAVADDEPVSGLSDAGGGTGEEVVLQLGGEVLQDIEKSDMALMAAGIPGGEIARVKFGFRPVLGGDQACGGDFFGIDIEPVDRSCVATGFQVKSKETGTTAQVDERLILAGGKCVSDAGIERIGADFPVHIRPQEAALVELGERLGI